MTDHDEAQLRGLLLTEAADITDAPDFARRIAVDHAVARRARRRRVAAVTAACAAAAAVAVGAAVVSSGGSGQAGPSHTHAPATGGSTAPSSTSIEGIDWVLVDIAAPHLHVDLAARHLDSTDRARGAWLELNRDGHMVLSDTLNTSSGPYRRSASTITFGQIATTLAGYMGPPSWRTNVIAAMGTLASTGSSARTTVKQGELVVHTGRWTLTFRNAGPSRSDTSTTSTTPPPPSGTENSRSRIEVPDVVGDQVADARQELEQAGFRVRVQSVSGGVARSGTVVAQLPAIFQQVPVGSIITVRVKS